VARTALSGRPPRLALDLDRRAAGLRGAGLRGADLRGPGLRGGGWPLRSV